MPANFALENETRLFWTPFWRTDREITSDFESAGRPLCGHHIVALVENAEAQILAFASRVKASGQNANSVNSTASGLFETFADDKRSVSQGWPFEAKEVLNRELDRAQTALVLALMVQPLAHGAPPVAAEFDEPKPDWLELWQGPLTFRATYDKGKFGLGHSLERINQFGKEGATSGGRYAPIFSVRLDPDDGAIVIEWLIGLPGRQPPYQSVRYYHGGLGRGLYNRLRDDADFRDQYLAHLPHDQRARAVNAYITGLSMREWADREFIEAVHAGHCEIWARVGSKVAPFRRIPADIFRSYEIQEWGYGIPGGAWAKLDGSEPLYSIRVAASDAYLAQSKYQESLARMSYGDAVQWCRDWISSGKGNGMDGAWKAFKEMPNTSGCARDTFFRPAWAEAKTKAAF